MKRTTNWQWGMTFELMNLGGGFCPSIHIWFFKFHSFPPPGERFTSDNYKGFNWWYESKHVVVTRRFHIGYFNFSLPVEIAPYI